MAIAIDPVCGMEVETEGAELTATHAGTTHYFCGRGCLLDFRDDPERYLHGLADAGAGGSDGGGSGAGGPRPDAAAG